MPELVVKAIALCEELLKLTWKPSPLLRVIDYQPSIV